MCVWWSLHRWHTGVTCSSGTFEMMPTLINTWVVAESRKFNWKMIRHLCLAVLSCCVRAHSITFPWMILSVCLCVHVWDWVCSNMRWGGPPRGPVFPPGGLAPTGSQVNPSNSPHSCVMSPAGFWFLDRIWISVTPVVSWAELAEWLWRLPTELRPSDIKT